MSNAAASPPRKDKEASAQLTFFRYSAADQMICLHKLSSPGGLRVGATLPTIAGY